MINVRLIQIVHASNPTPGTCNVAKVISDRTQQEIAMTNNFKLLPAAAVVIGCGAISAPAWADEDEIPFAEAHLFFELNDTDGDLGIHALIDGDPWKTLKIEDTKERRMLNVRVNGRLRRQGLTEFFFESAEPDFEELDPKVFFKRFPAGTYEIEGYTLKGEEMESETKLTHLIPAPPEASVNGRLIAKECDEDEAEYDAPLASPPITISWPEVKESHPELGKPTSSKKIKIHNYEVVVEVEIDDDFSSVMHVTLPPDQTSMSIPEEVIALAEDESQIKYEVLVRESSYNQTALESCFVLDLKQN